MVIGIICEYNPFHNGHIYHINKIKEKYPNSTIILVMSGSITQRGEISLINKWDKTSIALKYGIDLIVELPFVFASQSADIFAKGAVETLNHLHVQKIIFGSECNNPDLLIKLAKIQLSEEYNNILKKYIDIYSYPKACGIALKEISNIDINTPNDLLGLSYTKEIIKNNYNIEIETIKRTNDYHNKNLEKIASATSIRKAIEDNVNIDLYVPKETLNHINPKFTLKSYYHFLKYKILSTDDLSIYNDIDEKLSTRIKKAIIKAENLEDLILIIKSKNYTYNRIKRILVYILVDFKKIDNTKEIKYIRILGFNNYGKIYLNKLKKDINIPIITNYSNSNGLIDQDIKIDNILSLILPLDEKNKLNKEIKEVIRKIDIK